MKKNILSIKVLTIIVIMIMITHKKYRKIKKKSKTTAAKTTNFDIDNKNSNIINNSSSKPVVMQATQPRPLLPTTTTLNKKTNKQQNVLRLKNNNNETFEALNSNLIHDIIQGNEILNISTDTQKQNKSWVTIDGIPNLSTTLELEAELELKRKEYLELISKEKQKAINNANAYKEKIEKEQENRRKKFEEDDQKLLLKLQTELETRQKERDFVEKQRRVELQEIEKKLVSKGLISEYNNDNTNNKNHNNNNIENDGDNDDDDMPIDTSVIKKNIKQSLKTRREPVIELVPTRYDMPNQLPTIITEGRDVISKLDRMLLDQDAAKKRGVMNIADYEIIKLQIAERQLQREQKMRHLSEVEKSELYVTSAVEMQRKIRGFVARKKTGRLAALRKQQQLHGNSATKIQSLIRGVQGRIKFKIHKRNFLMNIKHSFSVIEIQRIARGYIDRKYFFELKKIKNCITLQRTYRGHVAKLVYKKEKKRLELLRKKMHCAAKIQSIWRMKVALEEFRSIRIHHLATIEIQRLYRGHIGRKKMSRKKKWETAAPGPERIKLGLHFIEESKLAFERQQEEIDALHRAQERAESRISLIHSELKESEKELVVLERELQEIDQIEKDLNVLTHERSLLVNSVEDAAGMPRTSTNKTKKELVFGKESTHANDPILERKKKAEAYALEMTIQIKRAEREKKRQELEIEFSSIFQEVEKKKKALHKLEIALSDMESTRERKDREFQRLQKNLMQLLLEQKHELDELREKGIELETATATSAAAAIATAHKAKEHEKKSTAMFAQTEELMKFQFMSMSLSYFSSLNMLKSLKEMNADTTSAAISMSADAAASAASAAAAANLPNLKKLDLGGKDFLHGSMEKKKNELKASEAAEKQLKNSLLHQQNTTPDVRLWTVSDVSRWLDSLSLNQYITPFEEASIDGPFLLEIREEDLVQVLNIKHKLHVRKILISRDKLRPLTLKEKKHKEIVEREEAAEHLRNGIANGVPTLDTVFSQARNGRVKRVEDSLNLGFPIDAEDERGNTLLLIAAQNRNKRLVEMLLVRGANINHQNAKGNTALHFALAFDGEGVLGEYLIEHGANDAIENIDGRTPYDGVAT